MAWELHSYIVDPGDKTIKVEHIFYGLTKAECLDYKAEHLESCSYFRSAEEGKHTDEEWLEIADEDLPTIEEDEESGE